MGVAQILVLLRIVRDEPTCPILTNKQLYHLTLDGDCSERGWQIQRCHFRMSVTQINSAINICRKEQKLCKASMNKQQNNKNSTSDCELVYNFRLCTKKADLSKWTLNQKVYSKYWTTSHIQLVAHTSLNTWQRQQFHHWIRIQHLCL